MSVIKQADKLKDIVGQLRRYTLREHKLTRFGQRLNIKKFSIPITVTTPKNQFQLETVCSSIAALFALEILAQQRAIHRALIIEVLPPGIFRKKRRDS